MRIEEMNFVLPYKKLGLPYKKKKKKKKNLVQYKRKKKKMRCLLIVNVTQHEHVHMRSIVNIVSCMKSLHSFESICDGSSTISMAIDKEIGLGWVTLLSAPPRTIP